MTEERMITKIMGLMAKAESTTPEEAELLLAKATELMVRYEIDQAMLAVAQGEKVKDEIIERKLRFDGIYALAQQDLFFTIGRTNKFRIIQSGSGDHRTGTWIGFKRDIEAAEVLYTSLLIQQMQAMRSYVKTLPTCLSGQEKYVAKRSHMLGFSDGVESVMSKATRTAEREAQEAHVAACPDSTTSVALVLKSKDEQVTDWYDEKYGHLRKGRASRISTSYGARNAGDAAGRSADLGSSRLGARKALGT